MPLSLDKNVPNFPRPLKRPRRSDTNFCQSPFSTNDLRLTNHSQNSRV
jgi:hypothetical protein